VQAHDLFWWDRLAQQLPSVALQQRGENTDILPALHFDPVADPDCLQERHPATSDITRVIVDYRADPLPNPGLWPALRPPYPPPPHAAPPPRPPTAPRNAHKPPPRLIEPHQKFPLGPAPPRPPPDRWWGGGTLAGQKPPPRPQADGPAGPPPARGPSHRRKGY